jgi:U3 small nucleolar RNA-associated protein 10
LNVFCLRLRKGENQAFLESIIATPAVPLTVINSLTSQLIKIAVKPEDERDKSTIARRLLSLIHQRYPHSLRSAADLLSEEEESSKEILDQLVIALATVRIFISSAWPM